jgi:hypothetical protein
MYQINILVFGYGHIGDKASSRPVCDAMWIDSRDNWVKLIAPDSAVFLASLQ